MWHEARKQEKKIRGMLVDHKKRAERRKIYYDKIKKDPAEFLQVWGRQVKIQIDPAIAAAADNPSVMTNWRGNSEILIDRFDVRSHLDIIEEYTGGGGGGPSSVLSNEIDEERMCNYERYKTLIQNEAADVSEEQCLKEIEIEEKYGPISDEKKVKLEPKATIGYVYEDSTSATSSSFFKKSVKPNESKKFSLNDLIFDSDDDLEFDFTLDIEKLDSEKKTILNKLACDFGMKYGDFLKILQKESNDRHMLKQQKLIEAQKSQFSGRRSRRERRIEKEKRLKERGISPLSYIVKESEEKKKSKDFDCNNEDDDGESSSSSSSFSTKKTKRFKQDEGKKGPNLIFITSFGEEKTNENEGNVNNNSLNEIRGKMNKIDKNQLLAIKQLRRRSSSNSSSHSIRVASKPAKCKDEDDDEDESDEDEAIKEYLKRKQDRLTTQTTPKKSSLNNSHSSIQEKNDEIKSEKEKMKKKMLNQINKQFKKDKEIEREKKNKDIEERRQREADLQYLTEKIKRREKDRQSSSSRSRSSSSSTSSSSSSSNSDKNRRSSRRRRSTGSESSGSSRERRSRRRRSKTSSSSSSTSSSSSSSSSSSRSRRKR